MLFFCLLSLFSYQVLSLAFDNCIYGNIEQRLYGLDKKGHLLKYTHIPHVDSAFSYVGVTDNGNNTGYWVELWQSNVNIPKGSPWCAAFVSTMLDLGKVKSPTIRSGLAKDFIARNSIPARRVFQGIIEVPAGSLVIWRKGETWKGHIGIIPFSWRREKGQTIEGNTSSNDDSNGDAVETKTREIQPFNYFRITHFTEVTY